MKNNLCVGQTIGNYTLISPMGSNHWEVVNNKNKITCKISNKELNRRIDMIGRNKVHKYIGCRFGKLTAIEHLLKKSYKCICDCGNETIARSDALISGATTSCGMCSNNTYEIKDDYVVVYTSDGREFYIDLEDMGVVKYHTWRIIGNNSVVTTCNNKNIIIHRLLMNPPDDMVVDHIDGNPLNNRRNNLRICTTQQNACNLKLKSDNTSGVTGVWFDKSRNKWASEIKPFQQKIYLGRFNTFDEAVISRIKAEIKYFGEYRSTRNDEYIREILERNNIYNLI